MLMTSASSASNGLRNIDRQHTISVTEGLFSSAPSLPPIRAASLEPIVALRACVGTC
jgi:hypothetical protein